jgi:hypothetical protein
MARNAIVVVSEPANTLPDVWTDWVAAAPVERSHSRTFLG